MDTWWNFGHELKKIKLFWCFVLCDPVLPHQLMYPYCHSKNGVCWLNHPQVVPHSATQCHPVPTCTLAMPMPTITLTTLCASLFDHAFSQHIEPFCCDLRKFDTTVFQKNLKNSTIPSWKAFSDSLSDSLQSLQRRLPSDQLEAGVDIGQSIVL